MLDLELVREYNRLERTAWQIIDRQSSAQQTAYQTLSERLSEIDGRMAEIERSVPASVLHAGI